MLDSDLADVDKLANRNKGVKFLLLRQDLFNRIGADKLEFAAPEIGEVTSVKKSFKSAAKSVGKANSEKTVG